MLANRAAQASEARLLNIIYTEYNLNRINQNYRSFHGNTGVLFLVSPSEHAIESVALRTVVLHIHKTTHGEGDQCHGEE